MHSNTKRDDRYRTKLERPLLDRSEIKAAEVGIIARKTWEWKDVVYWGETGIGIQDENISQGLGIS
jgi:hypothetical protein